MVTQTSEEEKQRIREGLGLPPVSSEDRLAIRQQLGLPADGTARRDTILARQGFAPPDSGIPEFLPGVEPKPSTLLGQVEQGLPRGNEITPKDLAALDFFQRNVVDPPTAAALGVGFRSAQSPWQLGKSHSWD